MLKSTWIFNRVKWNSWQEKSAEWGEENIQIFAPPHSTPRREQFFGSRFTQTNQHPTTFQFFCLLRANVLSPVDYPCWRRHLLVMTWKECFSREWHLSFGKAPLRLHKRNINEWGTRTAKQFSFVEQFIDAEVLIVLFSASKRYLPSD